MTKYNQEKYLRRMKLKKYGKYFYLGIIGILCFGIGVYFTYSKYSVSKETEIVRTTVGDFISGDVVIGAYINGEYAKSIPSKDDDYKVEKIVCDNGASGKWDYNDWGIIVTNLTKRNKCNVYFRTAVYTFDYVGSLQTFTIPVSGTYKLEVWAGQGGYAYSKEAYGGYGGYSNGEIVLTKGDILYITVGGQGENGLSYASNSFYIGGYNGGGNALSDNSTVWGGGGGATSIQNALIGDGQLKNYENNKSNVLIVAGAGGGGGWHYKQYLITNSSPYLPHPGGSGGGYIGNSGITESNSLGTGGTQMSAGVNGSTNNSTVSASFGYGGNYNVPIPNAGGGSGFYGGGSAYYDGSSGGGGSGYIGNSLLNEKTMYCYNCQESSEESTKTISTTCSEETPTENCSKKGNGYARITLVSID